MKQQKLAFIIRASFLAIIKKLATFSANLRKKNVDFL